MEHAKRLWDVRMKAWRDENGAWGGQVFATPPGVELKANLESISHRCFLFEVAFVWELTKETIHLPLGCLQGGPSLW